MDTLNSPASAQDGPSPDSANSPDGVQDGAGDQVTDKRVRDLMGLANRRLTLAQQAEAERDAARAEVDAMKAAMEAGWEAERAAYWQQEFDEPVAPDSEAGSPDGEPDEEDIDPDVDFRPRTNGPMNDPNAAPRSAATPLRARGSELDAARAAFAVASEKENERLRALLE